ncbi:tripartite motif-containing protein 54 isoform X3, partial [Scomber scombrus]
LVNVKPGHQQHQQQHLLCEEHEEEKINIYCLSCQTPTCSMCKVFGKHKDCDVAPLSSVYERQKNNGQRHREQLVDHFDGLVAILEERKQELVGLITREQDHKLKLVRSLIRRHGDHLEAAVTLVESAIQSMEEPHMSIFIQSATDILEKMSVTAGASSAERPELGYEDMSHFVVDTDELAVMLRNIEFRSGLGNNREEDPEEESELDFCTRY